MNNFFEMLKAINNPQQFISKIASDSQAMQNPIMKNGLDMFQKGDRQGLQKLVENVAKERGTSLEEIKSQMGIR